MPNKLNSRKLWAFIAVFAALVSLIVCNIIFKLDLPSGDLLYLVIIGATYILGQGYVDSKQQPVKDFPAGDVTQSVTNIIQAELSKLDFAKNFPMEKIIEAFTPILKQIIEEQTSTPILPPVSASEIPSTEPVQADLGTAETVAQTQAS